MSEQPQFEHPEFLRNTIELKPLKDGEYGEGSFTIVANLEDLPESVREKMPEGYVIKRYKDKRLHPTSRLFEFDPDSSMVAEDVLETDRQLKYNRP